MDNIKTPLDSDKQTVKSSNVSTPNSHTQTNPINPQSPIQKTTPPSINRSSIFGQKASMVNGKYVINNQTSQQPLAQNSSNQNAKNSSSKKPMGSEIIKPDNPKVFTFNKKGLWFWIISSALAVLIILSILLTIFLPKGNLPANIDVNFDITSEMDYSKLEFGERTGNDLTDLKILPGQVLPLSFSVHNKVIEGKENLAGDIFVRVRVYVTLENRQSNYYSSLFEYSMGDSSMWYSGLDGYLYYKGVLSPNTSANVFNSLKLKTSIGNEFNGKQIKLFLEGHALQADYQAVVETWETAPYSWLTEYARRGEQ